MPSEGPRVPLASTVDAIFGIVQWTTPANAILEDGNTTAVALTTVNLDSQYLEATNFGFSIPADSVIDGILAEIKKKGTNVAGGVKDERIRIIRNGLIGASDRSLIPIWPAGLAFLSHGGAADLWGESWTPSDINKTNFGLAVVAQIVGAVETAEIDLIRLTVFYHAGNSRRSVQSRSMMGMGL